MEDGGGRNIKRQHMSVLGGCACRHLFYLLGVFIYADFVLSGAEPGLHLFCVYPASHKV